MRRESRELRDKREAERIAVLRAFYQRGRKCFVPVTIDELRRRSGVESLEGVMRIVMKSKALKVSRIKSDANNRVTIYTLTQAGIDQAAAVIGETA